MRAHDYPTPTIEECTAVDHYFAARLAPTDQVLEHVLAANAEAGMPPHDVAPVQGKFLAVMVQISQAKRILEIGTLGGYSTICMARALPEDGRITTIDNNADFAKVAAQSFARAHVTERIDQRVGTALEILAGNPNLNSTALQTVGEKGWDGFSLTVVNALP